MRLLGRGKKEESEEVAEELEKKPLRRRSSQGELKDFYPEHSRKRKPPIKPWGKKERVFVFVIFAVMALSSAIFAASARNWKLPGLGRIKAPSLGSDDTIIINNPARERLAQSHQETLTKIKDLIKNYSGIYGVYVYGLESDYEYGVNEHEVMQAASLIKLPVIVAMYQQAEKGIINLDQKYTLQQSDKTSGSGSLYGSPVGTQLTYRELVELMGKQSDNTAFTICIKILGEEKINGVISSIGMQNTSLDKNTTTPYEVGLLFKKLWKGQLVSKKSRDEILGFLTNTIYEDWIPANIDNSVRVAHKYGREIHVINDAGIIFTDAPFVLVMMTDGVVESEANVSIPEIIKLIYSHQVTLQ